MLHHQQFPPEPIAPREISRTFRNLGLIVQKEAVFAVQNVLKDESDPILAMEYILNAITKKIEISNAQGSVVNKDMIETVVAELSRNEDDISNDSISVVSAFDLPIVKYSAVTKRFYFGNRSENKSLHGSAESKTAIYRERFELVNQRIMRNKNFSKPTFELNNSSAPRQYIEITSLDSLVGLSGQKNLLGMLTQREEGVYYLEDLNGSIQLNLQNAKPTAGLFTEGCIVVADGILHEDIFYVKAMGFPPPEDRVETLSAMSTLDITKLMGYTAQEEQEMLHMEQESDDAIFVIFSDVHLDNPVVMDKLRSIFKGYSQSGTIPKLFVFLGNFTSRPFGQGKDDVAQYKRLFDDLGDLIHGYEEFATGSRFVFVPGPTDPGAGNILPRHPLPSYFVKGIKEKVKTVRFATNPCRIRYYTQEIVVSRQNILNKMRRHCVIPPAVSQNLHNSSEEEDGDASADIITDHLVKTLMDQSHLCPLPLSVQPIYWNYDNALRLYPLPDMVILGDYYDQYHSTYQKCDVLNPGSFPTDFSFVVYRPAKRTQNLQFKNQLKIQKSCSA